MDIAVIYGNIRENLYLQLALIAGEKIMHIKNGMFRFQLTLYILMMIIDVIVTGIGINYGFSEGNKLMGYFIGLLGFKVFAISYIVISFILVFVIDCFYEHLKQSYKNIIFNLMTINNILRGFAIGGWVGILSNHHFINGNL